MVLKDMKQFVLWYGLNGKEYGVACKVHESFYDDSIEPWCLEVIEPTGVLITNLNGEVYESFQYIVRF